MQGRSSFTEQEITRLKSLIARKELAGRPEQKMLRRQMRDMGFYITDFRRDFSGFTVRDLDQLIADGTITVVGRPYGKDRHPSKAAPERPSAPWRMPPPVDRSDSIAPHEETQATFNVAPTDTGEAGTVLDEGLAGFCRECGKFMWLGSFGECRGCGERDHVRMSYVARPLADLRPGCTAPRGS